MLLSSVSYSPVSCREVWWNCWPTATSASFPKAFPSWALIATAPTGQRPASTRPPCFTSSPLILTAIPFNSYKLRGLDLKAAIDELSGDGFAQNSIPLLNDLLQDIGKPQAYRWEEEAYQQLDFGVLDDSGWRAMEKLGETPAFDGNGDLPRFLDGLCRKPAATLRKCGWPQTM